jgi:hypothetical protein
MYGQVIIRALLILTLFSALEPRAAWAEPQPPRAPLSPSGRSGALQPFWRPPSAGPASPPAASWRRLSQVGGAASQGQPVEPMHAVTNDPPPPPGEPPSITQKWWFWAAVGALVVSTTVLLVVATREPEAPRTRLGNMEAFR